jgi:hypothetical protein
MRSHVGSPAQHQRRGRRARRGLSSPLWPPSDRGCLAGAGIAGVASRLDRLGVLQEPAPRRPSPSSSSRSRRRCSPWRRVTRWRRIFISAGFPVGAGLGRPRVLASAGRMAAAPLVLLLLAYPAGAWRDAPLFPTRAEPCAACRSRAARSERCRARCGLRSGCRAARAAAAISHGGLERHGCAGCCASAELGAAACARIRRPICGRRLGGYDPGTSFSGRIAWPAQLDKAQREMQSGAWLVSLEFQAESRQAEHCLQCRMADRSGLTDCRSSHAAADGTAAPGWAARVPAPTQQRVNVAVARNLQRAANMAGLDQKGRIRWSRTMPVARPRAASTAQARVSARLQSRPHAPPERRVRISCPRRRRSGRPATGRPPCSRAPVDGFDPADAAAHADRRTPLVAHI